MTKEQQTDLDGVKIDVMRIKLETFDHCVELLMTQTGPLEQEIQSAFLLAAKTIARINKAYFLKYPDTPETEQSN